MDLSQYILRRLLVMIPVLVFVSIFSFSIIHITPGDPVTMMVNPRLGEEAIKATEARLGLDRSLPMQYLMFLNRIVRGDFGRSLYSREQVSSMILYRLPLTLTLMFLGLGLAYLTAIPIGVLAAVRRGSLTDYLTMVIPMIGVGLPRFWLGLILMLIFSINLNWFPVAGHGTVSHIVLPSVTLAATSMAYVARVMRSSMLEVLQKDYVRTARSKGLLERVVIFKHALRNAINPVIALFGLDFGWIIGGAVMVEFVFNRPGLGRLMVDSIQMRDYPVFQVLILFLTASVILGNLLGDVLLALSNPRIRHK